MDTSKSEMQKAFELHYLQQMKELKKIEKQHTLESLECLICEILSECDYVANNLIVSEPDIEALCESISFAINSIESAKKELEQM